MVNWFVHTVLILNFIFVSALINTSHEGLNKVGIG